MKVLHQVDDLDFDIMDADNESRNEDIVDELFGDDE